MKLTDCPYCGTKFKEPIFLPYLLSRRRAAILEFIATAGVNGVDREAVKNRFWKPGASDISVRTTINNINKIIKPKRIRSRNSVLRLMETK